jgi:hypothetical protein
MVFSMVGGGPGFVDEREREKAGRGGKRTLEKEGRDRQAVKKLVS